MSTEVKMEAQVDPGEGTSAGPSKNCEPGGGSPSAAASAVDDAVPSTSSAAADTKSATVKNESSAESREDVKEELNLKTEEEEEEDDLAASETMEDTSDDEEDEDEMAKALNVTGGTSVKDEEEDEDHDHDDTESNPDNPENNEEYAAQVLGQKPIQDMKLETALQGQEPTTRNLIIAAIGVMKNRKARPDSKRICNWIHRRYGQPYMAINAELERLVASGELARVDYKGSASFRIINKTGKVTKKRKKGTKPLGRTPAPLNTPPTTPQPMPAALQSPGGAADFMRPLPPPPPQGDFQPAYGSVQTAASAFVNFEPPQHIIAPPGALSMTSMPPPPPHSQEPISLRTLVNDILGDSAGNQGVTITTKFISKAIESTHRNINRATILGNLDLILEKEVQAGHFSKIGPDTYAVPPIQQLPPSLPFVPLPMANPDSMMAPPPPPPALPQPNHHPHPHHLPPPMGQSFSMEKTDEERKNELIQDTLSKLSSKDSPRASKTGAGGSGGKSKGSHAAKEPIYLTLREKRMAELSKKNAKGSGGVGEREKKGLRRKQELDEDSMPLAVLASGSGSGNGSKSKRRQREEWQMKPSTANRQQQQSGSGGGGGSGRLGSGRKKKSRKIFDPADHEQPVRKRGKISSSSPPPTLAAANYNGVEANVNVDTLSSPPNLTSEDGGQRHGPGTSTGGGGGSAGGRMKRHTEICTECYSAKNKLGKKEALVRCRDCPTIVHPSCLDYSEELARKILSATFWQCINCKTCSICDEADPLEDEHMLFCDSCDLGYHMNCHLPPIATKPPGKWICYRCQDASTVRAITRSSRSQSSDTKNGITITNGAGIRETLDHETARFLPLLPPHLHPHTGLLPNNWEDYPMDPTIPDVSDWEPINVMNYFMKQGFPTEHAAVFLNEEIDGSSLLLLHRQDVIGGLGLKLGPALKVFNQVKKLQTKRNLPTPINAALSL